MLWKLLSQNIRWPQFLGFTLANLLGLTIVLISVQVYQDLRPLLIGEDSLMKGDYIVVSKPVQSTSILLGPQGFAAGEIQDLQQQPWAKAVGCFTPSQFSVYGSLGMGGIDLGTDMFFESVPDEFVDIEPKDWQYTAGSTTVPILLPRQYLDLYNFGFASAKQMPQVSGSMASSMPVRLQVTATNGTTQQLTGHIAGFSNRLNTILVPEAFMQWANQQYGPEATGKEATTLPKRLIIQVDNAGDSRIASYLKQHGLETAADNTRTSQIAFLLRLLTGIVIAVGTIISGLAMYVLLLSIYLLLQKNQEKINTLRLLGYSRSQVARPYQLLSASLNLTSTLGSICLVLLARHTYLQQLRQLPGAGTGTLGIMLLTAVIALLVLTGFDLMVVRKKIA